MSLEPETEPTTGATLEQVGARAGCSPATVSRVLNNSARVSPMVRDKVMRAIRESGYLARRTRRPNRTAAPSSSSSTPTRTVEVVWHWHSPAERVTVGDRGLSIGPIESVDERAILGESYGLTFYRQLLQGILDELKLWRHKAVLQSNHNLLDPAFLADVNQPDKRGILFVGEFNRDLPRFVEQCTQPLVLVDQIYKGWPEVVTIDNAGGMMSAFEHIHGLGHREIGFVGARPDDPAFRERRMVFEWCMVQAGLPLRPEWTHEGTGHVQHTADSVSKILSSEHRPTALVCCNDNAALGVYRAAAACGLRIPEDLSVVGFDDIDAAALITPPLTTVHVPTVQLGRQAVRQLMAQPPDAPVGQGYGCEIRVRTELKVRGSTAAPARVAAK